MFRQPQFQKLLSPFQIKQVKLRNRMVKTSASMGLATEDGYVTDENLGFYESVARGGIGLIIVEHGFIDYPMGVTGPRRIAISDDKFIPGLSALAQVIHKHNTPCFIQLGHSGPAQVWNLAPGQLPVVSSKGSGELKELSASEIEELVEKYARGAERAREAGFDAVQVHAAHSYLLSEFLSPFANRREDDWGGTLENRLRIHREIYKDIRAKVGEDYPVLVKIGVQDGFAGGLEFSEGKMAAQRLAQWGYDALEISSGLRGKGYETAEFRTKINRVEREAYFRTWCKEIKSQVNVPVMMVGGLRTFELMVEVIQKGEADFVSLSRPFIREPGLVNAWKSGDYHRATCISCNKCFEALLQLEPLHCAQEKQNEKR